MKKYLLILFLFPTHFLLAQKVMYSSYFDSHPDIRQLQLAGKCGAIYWVVRQKSSAYNGNNGREDRHRQVITALDLFDERLEKLKSIDHDESSPDVLKTYFVAGSRFFDELVLNEGANHTFLQVSRYESGGEKIWSEKRIDSLPFHEAANSFLLLRSEDGSKLLLLAFEYLFFTNPRIHALLFDEDWKLLSSMVYTHEWLTQPMVQYDEFNFPVDPFANGPVRLTNDGQLIMVAPSRTNQNYLLFHFNNKDTAFTWKELKLPASASVEEIGLSIDEKNGQAFSGILCRMRFPTLKYVQLARYSMKEGKLLSDSSYRFNTLGAGKLQNENLVEENFISMPGGGFMLLKEYGRMYNSMLTQESGFEARLETGNILDEFLSSPVQVQAINQNGYTKFRNLSGIANSYSRGDLSLFYFPSMPADSSWSGLINKEQVTELNSSNLSYLAIPYGDKLYLVYNSFFRNEEQFGATTILDRRGNPLEIGGIVFWKLRNTLLFQRARQISADEVMVPYTRNRNIGFAVIRFQ